MKTPSRLVMALVFAAGTGAQPVSPGGPPAAGSPAKKVELAPPTAAKDAKAAVKKDEKKKDAKAKDDTPGKIEGMEIARGGGFMGLQIVNGTFKLSFYDAKKKPVAPNVARAAFRWAVSYQKQPERSILSPGGGANSLVSDKTVKPPYSFKLFITLFKTDADAYAVDGAADAGAESLTVDFTQ